MEPYTFDSNHHIGVLMGGLSTERDISLKSGQAVARGLRSKGLNVTEIIVNEDIAQVLSNSTIDLAWVALHGLYGEDGCIQGLLEILRIPYTSSGVQACAVSMHKSKTKELLRNSDIRLCDDALWNTQPPFPTDWTTPLVIKDPLGGSSIGVWLCHTQNELNDAIQECKTLGGTYLIEEYIQGIEITVALLQGTALPVITIIPHGEFFDLKAKYTKGETTYLAPTTPEEVIDPLSQIPIAIARDAQRQAALAFEQLGMYGVCRADFIVPCSGDHPNVSIPPNIRPVFLEMNAIPGMTETSLTPMAAGVLGITFEELTLRIAEGSRLEN